jgi:mannose/fructose-specific phosphotransferase system component IIA
MNFPMLITAATLPEDATEEEIRHVAAEAKNGVVLMNDFAFSAGGDEDE